MVVFEMVSRRKGFVMARDKLVSSLLVMAMLAWVQTGFAQSTPDSRRQLNQDIQTQQRQIQERSREIEQRVHAAAETLELTTMLRRKKLRHRKNISA
jgi:hypothetical protein